MEYIENVMSETLSGEKNGIDGKSEYFLMQYPGIILPPILS